MVNRPKRCKSTVRLTQAQILILIYAAEFVLAGEWPWDDYEPAQLEAAISALNARLAGDAEGGPC